jgi:hypothetical protein
MSASLRAHPDIVQLQPSAYKGDNNPTVVLNAKNYEKGLLRLKQKWETAKEERKKLEAVKLPPKWALRNSHRI